jgi:putative endonuclease
LGGYWSWEGLRQLQGTFAFHNLLTIRKLNMGPYFVYMLINKYHTVLYTGFTDELYRRANEHKDKLLPGFTKKYNVDKLVYYKECPDKETALHREKQLKRYRRSWKEDLINKMNPEWRDLSKDLEVQPIQK